MRPGFSRVFYSWLLVGAIVLGLGAGASAQTLATFESGHAFSAEDHVLALSPSTDWASEGNRSLKISHGSIPGGTANRLWIRVMEDVSWVGATAVEADFYVPPEAPHQYSAALMIQVGDGWTWYESEAIPLSPGENRNVVFRLDTDAWRSAATGWALGARPPMTGLRAWGFLVFSDHRDPGVVYLDNVRLVRPAVGVQGTDQMPRGALGTFEQNLRISGKAELTIVSQPKTLPGDAPMLPVGLVPSHWAFEDPSGQLELVTTTDKDGNQVQALLIKGLKNGTWVRIDLQGADMSAYKSIRLDMRKVGSGEKAMQFFMQDSSWSWHDTQDFSADSPLRLKDEAWRTIELTPADFTNNASFDDIKVLGFRTWDGDGDYLITNFYFVGEAEEETTVTELTRTHEISLTLDYDILPFWSVRVGAVMSDPVLRLGVVEVKGSEGPLSLRAFHNGKVSDTGDPLKLLLGSKYHENKASGIDATLLLGPATLRGQYAWPSDKDASDQNRIATAIVDMPVGSAASVSLIAAMQTPDGGDSDTAFGAAGKFSVGSVNVTSEVVTTPSQDEGFAWMVEASTPITEGIDVTLHAREYGKDVIPSYNDHTAGGYGQRHIDGKWKVSDSVDAGLYLQNWYRPDGSYDEILNKLSLNWRSSWVNLASFVETKRVRNAAGEYAFRESRTSIRATSKLFEMFDVTGLVWLDKKESGETPSTYLGRVSFEPLSQTTLTLEAAQVSPDAGADPTQNIYAKIARKFQNGELSLAFGKPTLNNDENAVANKETAKDYVEVKLVVEF